MKYAVSMPEKVSICLNRDREKSVGNVNDDVSIVCAEMVNRMTLRQKILKGTLR